MDIAELKTNISKLNSIVGRDNVSTDIDRDGNLYCVVSVMGVGFTWKEADSIEPVLQRIAEHLRKRADIAVASA